MRTEAPSPWPLLLSKLRQANTSTVTSAELKTFGLDPQALLDTHLIERLGGGAWRAPGCEHNCTPALDFETRVAEGLIGVACPYEPACWPGVKWHPVSSVELFSCSAEKIFRALHVSNGLVPLDVPLGDGVVPVGILNRRGLKLPVVWMLQPFALFHEACLGLRRELGGDGLVVLLGRGSTISDIPRGKIAVLDLVNDGTGDLHLYRALDLLDPSYRQRRVDSPTAIFDDVRLEFADEPGVRHIVRINGQEYGGFQRSDLKFLRLLLLAASRWQDFNVDDGGWLGKHKLQGDEKDHDLEALREELRRHSHPSLSVEERVSLVKRSPARDGKIRLAVPPTNIVFEESLAKLQLIGERQSYPNSGKARRTPGQVVRSANFVRRDRVAQKLLDEVRKLGVSVPTMNPARGE